MFTCLHIDAAQYNFLMTKKKPDQVTKSVVNPSQDIKKKWREQDEHIYFQLIQNNNYIFGKIAHHPPGRE